MNKFEEEVIIEYTRLIGAYLKDCQSLYSLAEQVLGKKRLQDIHQSAQDVVRLRQGMDRRMAELDEGVK